MVKSPSFYSQLSTKDSFNASVRHINRTLDVLDACGPKMNIADKINEAIDKKEILESEILSLANMLLVDKWQYAVCSRNLSAVTDSAIKVVEQVSTWKRFDFVLGYHHPDLGFIVVNPKNPQSAEVIAGFRKNELLNVYAGSPDDENEDGAAEAAELLFSLIEGTAVKVPAQLLKGKFEFQKKAAPRPHRAPAKSRTSSSAASRAASARVPSTAPAVMRTDPVQQNAPAPVRPERPAAPAQPALSGKVRMTPPVSVIVSNELFHNGNVEAWKRIIRSYNAKYPDLHVNVYYDGERIVDINSLFKWGKVKHGSCIQFTVSGENIQDVAKLSRYFQQGASPQFGAFLKGPPDSVMNLF